MAVTLQCTPRYSCIRLVQVFFLIRRWLWNLAEQEQRASRTSPRCRRCTGMRRL